MSEKIGAKLTKGELIGDCPKCSGVVKYTHTGPVLNGFMKGLGFKGDIGRCTSCKCEYHIEKEIHCRPDGRRDGSGYLI